MGLNINNLIAVLTGLDILKGLIIFTGFKYYIITSYP